MNRFSGKGISSIVLGEMGYKYGELFMIQEHFPMKVEVPYLYATINVTQFMDGARDQRSYLIVSDLKFHVYGGDKPACLRGLGVDDGS